MNKDKEIEKINACISELVYDKVQLRKAYNYYHCTRDKEQFKHLEDNYGLGTPTSIGFTPLIKKHIDVLVGEYLELDPELQISCKDRKTVSDIMRDKQLKIDAAVLEHFKAKLKNALIQIFLENKSAVNDPYYEEEINQIKEDVSKNYVSQYEIAAQNILNYIKNSRNIDLKNKMRELLTDLLISGVCYYRTKATENGAIKLEILNPLDTFIERNPNEYYLNKSPRAVIRRYLNREQILAEFGDELSSEAKEILKESSSTNRLTDHYVTTVAYSPYNEKGEFDCRKAPGILGGLEVYPMQNKDRIITNAKVWEVYECEWLEYKEGTLYRHEGVRIGGEIYIVRGESKTVIRSISNPKECSLSINGIFFEDKNGMPFSIMLSTMDLQDRYDLTIFYRDSLIASSGTVGDWLDAAHLPTYLGEELPDRVQMWMAYKKQGVALFDSSQEGSQLINTTFNGYDDTIKAQCIQAFQYVLESIEQQASSITGVFAEKLGGIQQRDAVSNVKVGIRQSTLLTKQYFSAMDLLYKEVNYDLLNQAKIAFKTGICGTLINGLELNQIYTTLPEYYTMTDFDIHIQDSTEVFQKINELKQISIELVKSGQADPEMMINIISAKNLTELKSYVNSAVSAKKKENNIIQQLQQKLQEMSQQLQEASKQINSLTDNNNKLQKEVEKNSSEKLALEQKRLDLDTQKVFNDKTYNDRIAANKEKQTELEYAQLNDNNPYNDKIKEA